jgi:poly(hydroxyalkanoate) granule-associated protein
MVKKAQKTSDPKPPPVPGLFDSQLAQAVKESAQQIWLAGMGAFAKAQEGRAKLFEALIKEGTGLQRKTQAAAEDAVGEVTGKMSSMAGDVSARAGQHWDKLESIFEQRTAKAMNKLGVPTAKDVDALIKRVDDLAAAVARLSKTAPASAKKAAKPAAKAAKSTKAATATPKPAAKRAPAKKRAG